MEQLIDAIMLRLNQSQTFSITEMELVRHVIMDVVRDYKVEPMKHQIISADLFCPKGYQEFFVDKIMQGLSDQSIKQYKFIIDSFLHSVCRRIDTISSEDISIYIYNKKVKDHVSTSYQNHIRHCLSSFFTWMFDHKYIPNNPIRNVKDIKQKQVIKTGFTDEEFEKLMNAATCPRDRAIMAVLAGSGIRRAELCGMKLSDLDLQNKRFEVCGKGNKERTCFLTPRSKYELEKYLQTRNDDSPYVFVTERSPKRPLKPASLTKMMNDIGDKAGVKSYTHKMRHYFADNAHESGLDVLDIARLMGHASVDTTNIYISRNVDDLALKHSRIR